jgi:LysM repeat protein
VESLKSILLLVVLSGVGYGVYVALNHAPPSEPSTSIAPEWNPGGSDAKAPLGGVANSTSGGATSAGVPASNPWLAAPSGAGRMDAVPRDPVPLARNDQMTLPGQAGASGLPPGASASASAAQGVPTSAPSEQMASPGGQAVIDPQTQARFEYEASMRAAQTLASQGKLIEALRELSRWYDHAAVPPEEQARLVDFLGQLAGTVIYSRKSFLAAPYTVRAGDSLESIAAEYQVPWQLLAKINGIDNPNNLMPGLELKVVRGPFTAQLTQDNAGRAWLALFVDGLYAGRFQVQGQWNKPDGNYPVVKFASNQPGVAPTTRPYISLGGDLHLRLPDDVHNSEQAVSISAQDMSDVFDILSERSQVTIRR